MTYGDKRDYPKIDLYLKTRTGALYVNTTTWSRTCREAVSRFVAADPEKRDAACYFARFQNPPVRRDKRQRAKSAMWARA